MLGFHYTGERQAAGGHNDFPRTRLLLTPLTVAAVSCHEGKGMMGFKTRVQENDW